MPNFDTLKKELPEKIIKGLLALIGPSLGTALIYWEDQLAILLPEVPAKWIIRTLAALLTLCFLLGTWIYILIPRLKYDLSEGTFKDKKGINYCHKCKVEFHRNSPMTIDVDGSGWRCKACNSWHDNQIYVKETNIKLQKEKAETDRRIREHNERF